MTNTINISMNLQGNLAEGIKAVDKALSDLNKKINNIETDVGKSGNRLNGLSSSLKSNATATNGAVRAQNKFQAEMKQTDRAMSKVNTTTTQTNIGLGKFAGLIGGALGTREIVTTLGGFDASMSNVKALTGATADEFLRLRNLAKKLGSETQFSASQSADAMGILAMSGMKTNEILETTPKILQLATAANIDLETAAKIGTGAMAIYGEQAQSAVDKIVFTTSNAKLNVVEYGEAMKNSSAVALVYGQEMNQVSGAIAAMANATIVGGEAGTGLQGVMRELTKGSKEQAIVFKQLGIEYNKIDPQKNSLVEIFTEIKRGMDSVQDESKKQEYMKIMFGEDPIRHGAALLKYLDTMKDVASMTGAQGKASEIAKIKADNLEGGIKGLKSAIEGLIIAIGDAGLTKLLEDITRGLTTFIRAVSGSEEALAEMPVIVQILAEAIGFLASNISYILPLAGMYFGAKMVMGLYKYGAAMLFASKATKGMGLAQMFMGGSLKGGKAGLSALANVGGGLARGLGGLAKASKVARFGLVGVAAFVAYDLFQAFTGGESYIKDFVDGFASMIKPFTDGVTKMFDTLTGATARARKEMVEFKKEMLAGGEKKSGLIGGEFAQLTKGMVGGDVSSVMRDSGMKELQTKILEKMMDETGKSYQDVLEAGGSQEFMKQILQQKGVANIEELVSQEEGYKQFGDDFAQAMSGVAQAVAVQKLITSDKGMGLSIDEARRQVAPEGSDLAKMTGQQKSEVANKYQGSLDINVSSSDNLQVFSKYKEKFNNFLSTNTNNN